jgi:RNA polymerase sigma-70 factor (ECF subfamily)
MGYVMIMTLRRTLLRKHLCLAKLETFRNESSIGTWIRIASNNCLRQIEKKIGFQSRTSCKHYRRKHKSLEPQIQFLQMHCRTSGNRPYYYLTERRGKAGRNSQDCRAFRSKYQSKIHRIKEKLTQKFKENGE